MIKKLRTVIVNHRKGSTGRQAHAIRTRKMNLAALSAAILMGSLPAGTSMAHAASLFRVQQRRRAVDRAARHQRSGQGRTGTTAAAGMER